MKKRLLTGWVPIATAGLLLGLAVAVAFGPHLASGVTRGAGGQFAPTDDARAAQALGQPLPQPSPLVQGWTRSGLTLKPVDPDSPIVPASVYESFAVNGTNIATLYVHRGRLAFDPQPSLQVVTLAGAQAEVTSNVMPNGTTLVGYFWARHGLVYNFHIELSHGVDRATADRVAASIP